MDYAKTYLNEKQISKSIETIENYEQTIKQFQGWVKVPLNEVTREQVIGYLNFLLYDQKLQRSTVNSYFVQIQVFYGWMFKREYILKNPTAGIDKIKTEKKAPVYLTLKELIDLLAVVEAYPEDKIIIKLFYTTGIRISELVHIKKGDIDFDRREVTVMGKGSKERSVLLPPGFLMELQEYSKDMAYDQLIFTFGARAVQKHVKKLAKMAGIKKPITPHKLRHSFATHALQSGGNVVAIQKLLGHASLNTTQLYTHYNMDELQEEVKKYPGNKL